jgi:hypothetical protein
MDEGVRKGLGCFAKGVFVLLILAVIGFGLLVGMCGGYR